MIFGLCTSFYVLFGLRKPNYLYVNKPASICMFNGLSVDSMGNIYIGDRQNDLIQVFNEKGEFLYGFYAGTSQLDVFDMDDQDRLYIAGGKGNRYEIFFNGKLESSNSITHEKLREMEKTYHSSRSKVFKTNNKRYKYSFLNRIVVTDLQNNEKDTISLQVSWWPWAYHVHFIFSLFGVVLFLSGTMGIDKLESTL